MYHCDSKSSISNDKTTTVSVTDHNQFKDNRHAFKCANLLTSTLCHMSQLEQEILPTLQQTKQDKNC